MSLPELCLPPLVLLLNLKALLELLNCITDLLSIFEEELVQLLPLISRFKGLALVCGHFALKKIQLSLNWLLLINLFSFLVLYLVLKRRKLDVEFVILTSQFSQAWQYRHLNPHLILFTLAKVRWLQQLSPHLNLALLKLVE